MKDTLKSDSSRECKEREENECSTPHTPHTLHTKEKRYPINIRLRRSLHKVFMKYCAISNMTAGQFYEEAAILFIDVNPVLGAPLVIENLERYNKNNNDSVTALRDILCTKALKNFIARVDNVKHSGVEIHPNNAEKLLKILEKCDKIKNRSESLESLMSQAMSYFE